MKYIAFIFLLNVGIVYSANHAQSDALAILVGSMQVKLEQADLAIKQLQQGKVETDERVADLVQRVTALKKPAKKPINDPCCTYANCYRGFVCTTLPCSYSFLVCCAGGCQAINDGVDSACVSIVEQWRAKNESSETRKPLCSVCCSPCICLGTCSSHCVENFPATCKTCKNHIIKQKPLEDEDIPCNPIECCKNTREGLMEQAYRYAPKETYYHLPCGCQLCCMICLLDNFRKGWG